MDEDGYVMINGRLKDLIIRGGENVYPLEVEQFLYRHPKIADVQVCRPTALLRQRMTYSFNSKKLCRC